jgi:hypothetical protein
VVPFTALDGTSESAATKFTNLVMSELKTRDVELVGTPVIKASTPKTRGDAAAALEAGRKAFDDLNFEESTAQLKKGLAALLADPTTVDFDLVLDAHVKLAAGFFRMGEEREAKLALQDLARLSPGFQLPAGFPPVFQKEFDKAKKRLEKQPKGQVLVEGPSGATVYLDGKDLGMVPATQEAVPAGMHYVKVELGHGDLFGQVIEVKAGTTRVKAARPALAGGIPEPNIVGTLDESTEVRMRAYTVGAKADYSVVGVVFRASDTQLTAGVALYSAKAHGFASVGPSTFDTDVLTANTEAFKLADELVKGTSSFSAASLPLVLSVKAARGPVVARSTTSAKPEKSDKEDVEVAAPKRTTVSLTPKAEVRALENKSTVVDLDGKDENKPPPTTEQKVKQGVPTWVWVVTASAVAVGAGVGTYFVYTAATKPVTGTVTATW